MQIEVRTTKLSKSSWANELIATYLKKISFFQKAEFKLIKDESQLLRGITDKDFVVICDERGESPSSKKLAQLMSNWLESGKSKIVFIVGGPFGLSDEDRERANHILSLSHFVMNQEVALVVLHEQIFRSLTIINNHPYHNS